MGVGAPRVERGGVSTQGRLRRDEDVRARE